MKSGDSYSSNFYITKTYKQKTSLISENTPFKFFCFSLPHNQKVKSCNVNESKQENNIQVTHQIELMNIKLSFELLQHKITQLNSIIIPNINQTVERKKKKIQNKKVPLIAHFPYHLSNYNRYKLNEVPFISRDKESLCSSNDLSQIADDLVDTFDLNNSSKEVKIQEHLNKHFVLSNEQKDIFSLSSGNEISSLLSKQTEIQNINLKCKEYKTIQQYKENSSKINFEKSHSISVMEQYSKLRNIFQIQSLNQIEILCLGNKSKNTNLGNQIIKIDSDGKEDELLEKKEIKSTIQDGIEDKVKNTTEKEELRDNFYLNCTTNTNSQYVKDKTNIKQNEDKEKWKIQRFDNFIKEKDIQCNQNNRSNNEEIQRENENNNCDHINLETKKEKKEEEKVNTEDSYEDIFAVIKQKAKENTSITKSPLFKQLTRNETHKLKKTVTFSDKQQITIAYDAKDPIIKLSIYNYVGKKQKFTPIVINNYLKELKSATKKKSIMITNNCKSSFANIQNDKQIALDKLTTLLKECDDKENKNSDLKQTINFPKEMHKFQRNDNCSLVSKSTKKPISICKKFAENPQKFFSEDLCEIVLKSYNLQKKQKPILSPRIEAKNNKNKELFYHKKASSTENILYNITKYFEEEQIEDCDFQYL